MNQFMLQASTHHILVIIRETDSLRHKCVPLPNVLGKQLTMLSSATVLSYESDIAIGEEMSW